MDPPHIDLVVAETTEEMFGFRPDPEHLTPVHTGGFSLSKLSKAMGSSGMEGVDLRHGVEAQLQRYLSGEVPPNDSRLEYLIQVIQECYTWERISITKLLAHATWHLRKQFGEEQQDLIMSILLLCGKVYEATAALTRPMGAVLERLRVQSGMEMAEFLSFASRALAHADEAQDFDETTELITKSRLNSHPFSELGDLPASGETFMKFIWESSEFFEEGHSEE